MSCDDLRLGGTLSASGIAGGTSINFTNFAVTDWSSILGTAGISGQIQVVNGRPGGFISGDLLGRERFLNLNIQMLGDNTVLETNTDTFLGLLSDPAGQYLEVDLKDGTSRFLYIYNLDPAPISQPRKFRRISAPLISGFPYWKQGGQESTNAVSGADTITNGGNRGVYDAVLVFSGDGTFTHSGLGWVIEVTGSAAPVTVDLGARTVVESGAPAINRIRRTPATDAGGVWGWFTPGSNSVTSTVGVTVTWRDSYS